MRFGTHIPLTVRAAHAMQSAAAVLVKAPVLDTDDTPRGNIGVSI